MSTNSTKMAKKNMNRPYGEEDYSNSRTERKL